VVPYLALRVTALALKVPSLALKFPNLFKISGETLPLKSGYARKPIYPMAYKVVPPQAFGFHRLKAAPAKTRRAPSQNPRLKYFHR